MCNRIIPATDLIWSLKLYATAVLCFVLLARMGSGIRTNEAAPNESLYNVDGWQYCVSLSHYDGRYDVFQASTDTVRLQRR